MNKFEPVKAIPKLVDYLKNSDTQIVQSASQTLHQFSKRDAAKSQLVTQRNVIPTLIIVLQQTNDPDTARAVTGTLHNVSQVFFEKIRYESIIKFSRILDEK